MRKLAYIFFIAFFLFGCATLEDRQKRVQQNPISRSAQNPSMKPAIEKLTAGKQFRRNGQYDKAIENYQQALTLFRKLGREDGIALSLGNIGLAYWSWGQHDKAIKNYQQALVINRKLGKEDGVATSLSNIGRVYRSWGQNDKAIENYQQALTIARRLGAENMVSKSLMNIEKAKKNIILKEAKE